MTDPAISTPATAAALPAPRWSAWALAGVGVLCLVGWGIAHSSVVAAGDGLRAHGVPTAGVVSEIEDNGRYLPDTMSVRFLAGGRQVEEVVEPGFFGAADYELGQAVTVSYDPLDPSRMTVDDIDPAAGWGWLISTAGLGGLVWSVVGVFGGVADRRRRRRLLRVLAGGPWTPVHVEVGQEDGTQAAGLVLTTAGGQVWRPAGWRPVGHLDAWSAPTPAFQEGYGWSRPVVHDRDAWWVVDGDDAVFSPDRGRPLLLTRRERT